jgi:electron transfer flavoprotein alpha subunit
MKILTFVKQVPDVNSIGFDPKTNRIIREGVPLMMNSFDKKAVEEALRLKEKYGAETVVASLGPPSALAVVNEAMRMGIDKGYLISDPRFGGSDTLATSKILSKFASDINPDIILMGKYSLDGETSQVPPEVAVMLSYHFKSSISKIELNGREAIIEHENEMGLFSMKITLPALFSVSEKINKARPIKSEAPDFSSGIERVDSSKLKIEMTGTEMSPTVVAGTRDMENKRICEMLENGPDLFSRIAVMLEESGTSKEEKRKIVKPNISDNRETILGIALDDPVISQEIASRITALADSHDLNPVMIGNVDPKNLVGMPAALYYHISSPDLNASLKGIYDFILGNRPAYVIFPSTTRGREIAGTIAGRLNLGLTADCVDLEIKDGRLIQYKPSFGGSIIASIYSKTKPEMATVRPGMFKSELTVEGFPVKEVLVEGYPQEEITSSSEVPESFLPLRSSRVVLGIGRGASDKATIEKVLKLADLTSASVGASRPVVDMGLIPRQQQIGLTGYSISPEVYIAIGISGMSNHVVGLRYCKKVIAVNRDPKAPIFNFADYGVVMDANSFLDGIISAVESRMRSKKTLNQ